MIQGVDDRMPRVAYTISEVAHVLAVSEHTVRRMIDRGDLRALRIGRSVRIPVVGVEAYTRFEATQAAS